MKKALLILMVALLAAASVLALTACSNPVGEYKFESLTIKGYNYETKYNVGDTQPVTGETLTEGSATMTLNKDGSYVFQDNTTLLNSGKSTGTWKKYKDADGKDCIEFDNENYSAEYTADGLIFCYNDMDLIYYTFRMKKA